MCISYFYLSLIILLSYHDDTKEIGIKQ